MAVRRDLSQSSLPILVEEVDSFAPGISEKNFIGAFYDMATTTLSVSPKATLRSGPAAMHCDCSASPRGPAAMEVETAQPKTSSPGALQIQLEEKYLLEKIPSPIRVKPDAKPANEPSSPELSPPPSPKRKREVDFSKDLKDVAFTAVLPSKNVDLTRSQSTF